MSRCSRFFVLGYTGTMRRVRRASSVGSPNSGFSICNRPRKAVTLPLNATFSPSYNRLAIQGPDHQITRMLPVPSFTIASVTFLRPTTEAPEDQTWPMIVWCSPGRRRAIGVAGEYSS